MARKWTPEQRLAIDTRDRTLLVSAAAGSGKTATLTERIIRSILDDERPADIGRMLIVTFTNAAVGELRERIGAAIKTAFSEHPDNKRLEKQLLTVKDAKIMTISSFCNDVLKANSQRVGLPPNYRIADEAEAALISKSVMEPLINLAFEGELPEVSTAEEFAALADMLTGAKNASELGEVFELVYGATECYADRMGELLSLVKKYDPEAFTTVEASEYGAGIMKRTRQMLECYRSLYEKTLEQVRATESREVMKRAEGVFEDDLAIINGALLASDYESMRAHITSAVFARRPAIRGETSYAYGKLCEVRSMLKDDLGEYTRLYFTYSTDQWRELYEGLYKHAAVLYRFIRKFDEVFTAEKKARAVCEYGDLERYAYLSLYEDGKPNALAEELKESFEAVYIDEYQDVNDLENAIFEAVSRPDNRFMVGDIKQSIYGFRLANPNIFANMKRSFPPLGSEGDHPGASLFMSNNFRSDKTVIDFANGVFDKLFGTLGESIGYVDADRLRYSKVDPEGTAPTGIIPEIHVLEAAPRDGSLGSFGDEEEREIISSRRRCAIAVAEKIRELLDSGRKSDGSRIRPSDIAIMMRSTKSSGDVYKEELARLGIGSSIKDSGSFFLNEEILLALSLLNSIDNPRKDIYLASLMCSPLFSFTPDELVTIRHSSDKETLYEALTDFCRENADFEKGRYFLASLERYRALAEGMSVDTLLGLIWRETGLLSLAARNGGKDNLILLHSYARRFESSSFKGLYSFINYINSVIADNEEFSLGQSADAAEDAVNIMTVHKSKGLEYPVCFLVGAESATKRTSSARLVFAESFGIGMRMKDSLGLAIVENPIFNLIKAHISEREYEEELRVLYVALTRPREQMYVYGTPRGKLEKFMEKNELLREIYCPYIARNLGTVLSMITVSYDKLTAALIEEPYAEGEPEERTQEAPQAALSESGREDSLDLLSLEDELYRRFTFEYPRKYMKGIPAKLSVSRLYPELLDRADEDTARLDIPADGEDIEQAELTQRNEKRPYIPAFIAPSASEESAKRGIATHLVMQFADFSRLECEGARSEVERLREEKFISDEDAARVRIRELETFVRSPLFGDIKGAKRLLRELRFNVKLPAYILTRDEERREALKAAGERVLVQGVIDCLIEMPDGSLRLIDYKTDRLLPEERENKDAARRRLRDKHRLQLSYYRIAIERMLGTAPHYVGIYSLALGELIEVDALDERDF